MSENMSLQALQQVEMELLRHFRDFCQSDCISYQISNGTLLGAVKYGGFVPWDDDIDVFVPRADYDRLLREYVDQGRFKLFAPQRVAGFGYPFAKLCDMATQKVEEGSGDRVTQGVNIDIFPLDSWGDTLAQARRRVRAQMRNMTLLRLAKNPDVSGASPARRRAKRAVARLCKALGPAFFLRRMERTARRCPGDGAYQGCVVWPVYGQREVLPRAVFARRVWLDFEGERLPAPAGYDQYLHSLYGDYPQDPPPEKQESHHRFRAWFL